MNLGDFGWGNNGSGGGGGSSTTPQIGVSIDGLGSALQVQSAGFSFPSFTGIIKSWGITGGFGEVGNAVIDVRKNGVSIVGTGNKPTITTSNNNTENVLGWDSVSVTAGDYIEWYLESVDTFKTLNCFINIQI